MKSALLDTQILIWFLLDVKLKIEIQNFILDENTKILVSLISFYEIAIKQKIGKLNTLDKPVIDLIDITKKAGIEIIELKPNHIKEYSDLEFFPQHRDPFDRLLIATAIAENIDLISADRHFALYQEYVNIISA